MRVRIHNHLCKKKLPVGYTVSGIVSTAGGPTAVAAACGVSIQSVMKWKYIPGKHARQVAIMAGLPIEVVRPDFVSYDYHSLSIGAQ